MCSYYTSTVEFYSVVDKWESRQRLYPRDVGALERDILHLSYALIWLECHVAMFDKSEFTHDYNELSSFKARLLTLLKKLDEDEYNNLTAVIHKLK